MSSHVLLNTDKQKSGNVLLTTPTRSSGTGVCSALSRHLLVTHTALGYLCAQGRGPALRLALCRGQSHRPHRRGQHQRRGDSSRAGSSCEAHRRAAAALRAAAGTATAAAVLAAAAAAAAPAER